MGSITGTLSNQTDLQTALNGKVEAFIPALVKSANYSTANNNSETNTLLVFTAGNTVTLDSTGLTAGFKQQVFNDAGSDIAIASANTILGVNIPLANGYYATYEYLGANEWALAVGGAAGSGGVAVDSVNGQTGVVVLDNTDVGAAATNHTHTIANVTGLQSALDDKVDKVAGKVLSDNNFSDEDFDIVGHITVTQSVNLDSMESNIASLQGDLALKLDDVIAGSNVTIDKTDPNNPIISATSTGGVTDHGALTGLADDDHPQYFNQARGDARYGLLGTYDRASSVLSGASVFSNIVVNNGVVTNTATRNLTAANIGAAAASHTHAIADVTGLQNQLDKIPEMSRRPLINILSGTSITINPHVAYDQYILFCTNANTQTITLNADGTFDGNEIKSMTFVQNGAGQLVFTAGTVTIRAAETFKTRKQYSMVTAIWTSTNEVYLTGDLELI